MTELPSAEEVRRFHTRADTDSGPLAAHHTLGVKHNQAAHGDHVHDGIGTRKLDLENLDGLITETQISDSAVTSPKISGNAIDGKLITGAKIQTLAQANRGIKLDGYTNQLTAYDSAGNPTFLVNGSNGNVDIAGDFKTSFSGARIVLSDANESSNSVRFYYNDTQYNYIGSNSASLFIQNSSGPYIRLEGDTVTVNASFMTRTQGGRLEAQGGLKIGSTLNPILRHVSFDITSVSFDGANGGSLFHGMGVTPTLVIAQSRNANIVYSTASKNSSSVTLFGKKIDDNTFISGNFSVEWIAIVQG